MRDEKIAQIIEAAARAMYEKWRVEASEERVPGYATEWRDLPDGHRLMWKDRAKGWYLTFEHIIAAIVSLESQEGAEP